MCASDIFALFLTQPSHILLHLKRPSSAISAASHAGAPAAPRWTRQLVIACVLPRLVWASDVWLDPASGTDRVSPLARVWKEACRLVCGGTRTAASEALAVEAGFPPVRLLLRKSLFRAAVRALAAPPAHPLHHRVRLARASPAAVHAGPLHRALIAYPLLAPTLPVETLLPDPIAPCAPEPVLDVRIDETKEKALETHLAEIPALPSESLLVYSDGSLLDGRAGAGVVSHVVLDGEEAGRELLWASLRSQLGALQTVYVAELKGLRLALATLAESPAPTQPAVVLIAIDNQAVLLQPASTAPTSVQQHRLAVRSLLLELEKTHPMRWVPGHRDVARNDRADEEAKKGAAGGGGGEEAGATSARPRPLTRRRRVVMRPWDGHSSSSSSSSGDESEWEGRGQGETSAEVAARVPPKSPPCLEQHGPLTADGLVEGGKELPKAVSALWQHKVEKRARWEQEWAAAKVGRGLHRLALFPSTAHRYHAGLSRRQATLLAHLRLDCASLDVYLARTRQRADGACQCG